MYPPLCKNIECGSASSACQWSNSCSEVELGDTYKNVMQFSAKCAFRIPTVYMTMNTNNKNLFQHAQTIMNAKIRIWQPLFVILRWGVVEVSCYFLIRNIKTHIQKTNPGPEDWIQAQNRQPNICFLLNHASRKNNYSVGTPAVLSLNSIQFSVPGFVFWIWV